MRISHQTDKETETFDDEITLSSGVDFDHRKTLKQVNAHKRGKFINCTDEDMIFWALGQQRAPHFAKKLDLDTRHFQVEGYGDYNYYQAWACNVRFRKWSRDTEFSNDLDDFGDALADFGSTALKLMEGEEGGYDLKECDLLKMWFDPTIKSFYKQTKIELHELEKHQVLEMKRWENKEDAWEKAEVVNYGETEKEDAINQVAEKRKFWERVGYFNLAHYKKGDLIKNEYIENPEKDDWQFIHTIHSCKGADEKVVFAEIIEPKDDVYADLHISKYEDRWLRVGIYERLFGLQKMINEAVNYDREAQQIASLLMFKTKNRKLVGSSVLQHAMSGLITDADLEQIGISNQFLGDFVNKMQIYENKADMLCMTPDVIRGEANEPTFRGLAAQINLANSAFKKARDRISKPISKILIKKILPHEMKEWNQEKSLEIAGFDIDVQIGDAIAVIVKLNEYVSDEFKKGKNPTKEEKMLFVENLRQRLDREGRKFKIPESFYDFDFGLGISATNESENRNQLNDAYFNVITWVLNNPAVGYIPAFREYCEKNNITPFHLTAEQTQQIQSGQIRPQPVGQPQKDKLSASIENTEEI